MSIVRSSAHNNESDDETTSSEHSSDSGRRGSDDTDIPLTIRIEGVCRAITESTAFTVVMLLVIAGAAVVQGAETYNPGAPTLNLIEQIITYIFLAEIVLKILATLRRPHRFIIVYYFLNKTEHMTLDYWNIFDTIVVCLSFAKIHAIAVLRLIRLLRLLKFVKSLPQLQLLVSAVITSMEPITYIIFFLLLFWYFFGVIGGILFGSLPIIGCSSEYLTTINATAADAFELSCANRINVAEIRTTEDYYFGSLLRTMILLFCLSFRESWVKFMMSRIVRCDRNLPNETAWPLCRDIDGQALVGFAYIFIFYFFCGVAISNLVCGIMNHSMSQKREEQKREGEGVSLTQILTRRQRKERAKKESLFKSFLPIRLLIFLNLMRPFDPKKNRFDSLQSEMLRSIDSRLETLRLTRDAVAYLNLKQTPPEKLDFSFRGLVGPKAEKIKKSKKSKKKIKKAKTPKIVTPKRFDDSVLWWKRCPYRDGIKAPPRESKIFIEIFIWFGNTCAFIVHSLPFEIFGIFLVLLAAAALGIESDADWLDIINQIVKFGFLFELIMKFFACGCAPYRLLFSSWRPLVRPDLWIFLDIVVVVGGLANVQSLAVLRIFRILKLAKLFTSLPALGELLAQLFDAFSSVGWIMALLFIISYVFAVGGAVLFQKYNSVFFGNMTLAGATLLSMALGDDWDMALYSLMEGCDTLKTPAARFHFPDEICDRSKEPLHFWGALYFFIYGLVTVLCVMKLVIGIIISSSSFHSSSNARDATVSKMLEEAGMELVTRGGETYIETDMQTVKIFFKRLAKLERENIWQTYRLLSAHVAPLYLSLSLLSPVKRSRVGRPLPVPPELHPHFDPPDSLRSPIPPPYFIFPGTKRTKSSSLAVTANFRACRIISSWIVSDTNFFDYIHEDRLDSHTLQTIAVEERRREKRAEINAMMTTGSRRLILTAEEKTGGLKFLTKIENGSAFEIREETADIFLAKEIQDFSKNISNIQKEVNFFSSDASDTEFEEKNGTKIYQKGSLFEQSFSSVADGASDAESTARPSPTPGIFPPSPSPTPGGLPLSSPFAGVFENSKLETPVTVGSAAAAQWEIESLVQSRGESLKNQGQINRQRVVLDSWLA